MQHTWSHRLQPPQVDFLPSGRMGPAAAALSVAAHRAVGPTCAELEMQVNLGGRFHNLAAAVNKTMCGYGV